ncbi:MAG: hypothetical protein ACYC3X_27985 [Pirellulaceae bacterium]
MFAPDSGESGQIIIDRSALTAQRSADGGSRAGNWATMDQNAYQSAFSPAATAHAPDWHGIAIWRLHGQPCNLAA